MGTPYKMKGSPMQRNFGISPKKTDMGELRSKQARSSKGMSEFEYRKTKEYKAEAEKKKQEKISNEQDNKELDRYEDAMGY